MSCSTVVVGRRLLTVTLTATALLGPVTAHADVLVDESFDGPTAASPLRVGGSFTPCLTASADTGQPNVPGCPAGQPSIPAGGDPDGAGALRVTDNAHNRSGYAIYDRRLPFTSGVRFTFTTFAYHGTRVPGYGAADGISVFLTDGSVNANAPGAFGGSLGYAQKSRDFNATVPDVPGVPGGYVGVGIDEFGNFANDHEARGYGCTHRVDHNLHPNYLTVRGAGLPDTDWLQGYCVLDRAPAPPPGVLDAPDATSRTAPGVPHTFRIEIDPLGQPDGTPNPNAHVRVYADMGNTGTFVLVLDSPLPPDPPATFEFGVAASTGDGTNIHEIRAVRLETIDELPRWTLTKTHGAPLVAGETGAFTLTAASAAGGGVAYAPIRLDDQLPAGLRVQALPHGTGWDCTDTIVGSDTARCTYDASLTDPIRPGTTLPTVTLPVRVDPDAVGHRVNTAALTGPEILDPVTADDPFDLVDEADVGIVKTADPTRILAGGATGFTLVVTNHGRSDAHDVVVADTLPPELTLTDNAPSQGSCTATATGLRCELGTVRAGASAQILVDARSSDAATAQTVRNHAAVSTSTPDTDPSNDQDDADVEIVRPDSPDPPPDDRRADLHIRKTASVTAARPGTPVTYTIVVENRGSGTAHDVHLVDTNSMASTIRSIAPADGCTRTDAVLRCDLGDLPAGARRTITVVATFTRAGTADNDASVTPPDGPLDQRTDHARVRVLGGAAIRLVKAVDHRSVRVGARLRFRLRVTSRGPEPLERVRVCDRLPTGLRLLDAHGGRGGRTVCWTLRGLAAGRAKTYALDVRATRPGRPRNLATATAANARTVRARRSVRVLTAHRAPAFTG